MTSTRFQWKRKTVTANEVTFTVAQLMRMARMFNSGTLSIRSIPDLVAAFSDHGIVLVTVSKLRVAAALLAESKNLDLVREVLDAS